jgi:hypothetical protein
MLDRSFGKMGVAQASLAASGGPTGSEERTELFPVRHRIVVVRDGPGQPVLGFTPNGSFEPAFASGAGIAPGRSSSRQVFPGPFGALQRGKVVLAWANTLDPGVAIDLQRLSVG